MLRFPVAGITREVARGTRDARAAGVCARFEVAPRAVRDWELVLLLRVRGLARLLSSFSRSSRAPSEVTRENGHLNHHMAAQVAM